MKKQKVVEQPTTLQLKQELVRVKYKSRYRSVLQ